VPLTTTMPCRQRGSLPLTPPPFPGKNSCALPSWSLPTGASTSKSVWGPQQAIPKNPLIDQS
jgi:hypothetical protein